MAEDEKPKKSEEPKPKKLPKKIIAGDLRILASEAYSSKISAYEGLKNNGVIKSPLNEFAIA